MDVYLTGFGVHLLLKGFTAVGDVIALINIMGTSDLGVMESATIDILLIKSLPWPLNAIGPLMLGPILRLSYVAYSKARCLREGKDIPHLTAAILSLGKFGIGNMAFPAQMLSSGSRFETEYLLSKMGKKFPVFGGTDSRIEHWMMRRVEMRDSFKNFSTRFSNILTGPAEDIVKTDNETDKAVTKMSV
jgi:hypothetical protein